MIFLEEGFSQEEYRAFCATGEGNGVKNDCSSSDGGGAAPRATSAWKSKQETVSYSAEQLSKKPPAKSLAGIESVTIVDGELTADSLKEVGVTLDQAVRACAAVTPDSDITIAHGGLKDIMEFMSSDTPERVVADRVTVVNSMSLNGIKAAVSTAASLHRDPEDQTLTMTYVMLRVSEEAQKTAQFSVARQMMRGTVESITQAEKIGVDRVEMIAAGDSGHSDYKGYRIWPRLGFDGVIPRGKITPTYTLAAGLFNSYGSKIPKSALSPRAQDEVKRGQLTVQALYETEEGQKWWEQNGSEIEMTLDIGDSKSPGWNRFKALRDKFSSRSIDMFEAFFDAESADVMDQAWAEIRAYCATGEGGGQKNDCPPSSVGTAAASDDWKSERKPISMTYDQLDKAPPVTGGDVLDSFSISDPQMTQEAMKNIGIPTMDDLVTLGGGVVRRGDVAVHAGGDDFVTVNLAIPVSTTEDYAGSVHTQTVITQFFDDEGRPQSHLAFEGLVPKDLDRSSDRDVARVTSIMMQRVVESMSRADDLGFATASMEAVGDASRVMKGYRLWPQFGFDGEIPERTQREIPAPIVEQVWRKHRPDLFATRVPASAILRGLRAKPMTIQQLISINEGDRWWNENGSNITLSLDFNDKSSLGYKKFKEKKDRLPRLRERNKSRSMEEWIEDLIESRACDDSDKQEGGRFAPGNDCGSDGGGGTSTKEKEKPAKETQQKDVPLGNVRRQDVMLRGGKSTVVIDSEAKDRAREDLQRNPKPSGSHPASTSDLYGREFVRRDDPKKPNKITSHDPVFADSDLAQQGMFVAHDSVGRLLTARHEDERRKIGGQGPAAVFDTRRDLPPDQFEYLVAAMKEDVDRAYGEGRNPGFYSTDIAECMDVMSSMYPELKDPEEAKRRGTTVEDAAFVFTMITAITSNGTDPALNLESADRIYRLYREHGSVRTSDQVMGGERAAEIRKSLDRFQVMIDEFGESRVRNLLSGVTSASTIASTMKRLAKKSAEIGGSWQSKDLGSSELADEVVPVAAIFGPKIGSFYANLSGKHQFLTMDRWLMRSVGRVTGELLTRSTPESANKQANAALKAIRAMPKSKEVLFGVDKPPLSLKREDVIRSLELQARSGIVEESGAAFVWAQAAQRAYSKVPRGVGNDGKPYGSFGKHPDPDIQRALDTGNTITKSLVHEQQDPRSARARSVLRKVFREVAKRVAEENPGTRGDVQVSEIQAVLWQYEQNLWKRLGAKTKIEGDSLYSAAAKSLKSRRDSGDIPKSLTPEKAKRPKSVRSYEQQDDDGQETDYPLQSGQDLWDDESETAGFDAAELLKAIAADIESRSCERESDGKFASGNTCQIGININDKDQDFTGQILSGEKTVETRPTDSLRPYVGKTVGIVRTGKGKATLVGTMKVGEPKFYKTKKEFDADYGKHRVSKDSPHYIGKDGKHGYPLTEIKKVEPVEIDSKGIVARVIGRSHDFEEIEYSIESRAFCPTGKGNGVKNDCGSDGQAAPASSTTANSHAPSSSTPIISKFYDLASADKAENQAIIDAQTGEVIHQDRGKAVGESADVFEAHVEVPLQLLTGDRPFHQIHTHPDPKETSGPSDSDWGMLGWGNVMSVTTVGPDGFYQISRPTTGKTFTPKHLRDSWEMAYSDTVDRMKSDGTYSDATIPSIIDKVNETLASRLPGFSYSFTPRKPLTQSRSADCGRDDGGKFGSGNDCAKDGSASTAAAPAPAKSSQFSESISDSNGKHDWEKGKGDPPFAGADKYAAVGISAPKQVSKSLDSIGVTPSQLLDMSGANAGGETVYVRPAPEFKNDQPFAGSGVIPLFVDFSRDIAGVKDGLGGSSVIGSKKSAITGESSLNIYHNMITVSETVRKDPVKRQTAAREFYRAMVSSVDAARKAGVTRVHLNAAGSQKDYYKGYTIWPRMGFDAPIPSHIAAKLPPDLSHAKTLLDLHATREGTRWWADNGDDVDVSLDITDRSSPQNKLFDRFSKHFGTDRRAEYPGMPSLDGWLSEEDTAKIEGVWEEIWDSDLLDDYSGEEQNFDVDS